jgi:KaiC/GvpD/RAD55 family RecA-like ATPase
VKEMVTGGITAIEGEDTVRTIFSLQFVYRGSTIYGEYGCFISGAKTLEEIDVMMNTYGMSPGQMRDFPSIIMLDAEKLKKISTQANGDSFQLKILLNLLVEIHKDIKFTRLAIDRFDLLSGECTKRDIESFFKFARKNSINVILTIDLQNKSDLFLIYAITSS